MAEKRRESSLGLSALLEELEDGALTGPGGGVVTIRPGFLSGFNFFAVEEGMAVSPLRGGEGGRVTESRISAAEAVYCELLVELCFQKHPHTSQLLIETRG